MHAADLSSAELISLSKPAWQVEIERILAPQAASSNPRTCGHQEAGLAIRTLISPENQTAIAEFFLLNKPYWAQLWKIPSYPKVGYLEVSQERLRAHFNQRSNYNAEEFERIYRIFAPREFYEMLLSTTTGHREIELRRGLTRAAVFMAHWARSAHEKVKIVEKVLGFLDHPCAPRYSEAPVHALKLFDAEIQEIKMFIATLAKGDKAFQRYFHHKLLQGAGQRPTFRDLIIEDSLLDRSDMLENIALKLALRPHLDAERRQNLLGSLDDRPEGYRAQVGRLSQLIQKRGSLSQKATLPYLDAFGRRALKSLEPRELNFLLNDCGDVIEATGIDISSDKALKHVEKDARIFVSRFALGDVPFLEYTNELYKRVARFPEKSWIRNELLSAFINGSTAELALQKRLQETFQRWPKPTSETDVEAFCSILKLSRFLCKEQRNWSWNVFRNALAAKLVDLPDEVIAAESLAEGQAALSRFAVTRIARQLDRLQALPSQGLDLLEKLADSWGSVTPFVYMTMQLRLHSSSESDLGTFVSDALAASDPEHPEKWPAYRYNLSDSGRATQLAGLSAEQLEVWKTDFFGAPEGEATEALVNHSRYALWITDHPQAMLQLGEYPRHSGVCTDPDGDPYYNATLLSNWVDGHIRAAFVVDCEKLATLQVETGNVSAPRVKDLLECSVARRLVKLSRNDAEEVRLIAEPVYFKNGAQYGEFAAHRNLDRLSPEKRNALPQRIFDDWQMQLWFDEGLKEALAQPMTLSLYRGAFADEQPDEEVTISASKSPLGQMEDYDGESWYATYSPSYRIAVKQLKSPLLLQERLYKRGSPAAVSQPSLTTKSDDPNWLDRLSLEEAAARNRAIQTSVVFHPGPYRLKDTADMMQPTHAANRFEFERFNHPYLPDDQGSRWQEGTPAHTSARYVRLISQSRRELGMFDGLLSKSCELRVTESSYSSRELTQELEPNPVAVEFVDTQARSSSALLREAAWIYEMPEVVRMYQDIWTSQRRYQGTMYTLDPYDADRYGKWQPYIFVARWHANEPKEIVLPPMTEGNYFWRLCVDSHEAWVCQGDLKPPAQVLQIDPAHEERIFLPGSTYRFKGQTVAVFQFVMSAPGSRMKLYQQP